MSAIRIMLVENSNVQVLVELGESWHKTTMNRQRVVRLPPQIPIFCQANLAAPMVQIISISTSIINNRGQIQQPRDQRQCHRPQLTSYAPGDLHRAARVSTYPMLRSVANERSHPEPVFKSAKSLSSYLPRIPSSSLPY